MPGDGGTDAGTIRVLPTDLPATCSNEVRDGFETGIDCGGMCTPCDACAVPSGAVSCRCNLAWYSPMALPTQIRDIEAIASDFVVAASSHGYLLWDGATWRQGNLTESTWSAGGTSSSDLWLGAITRFWHWDGTAWSTVPHDAGRIYRVLAFATDDAWAVGDNGYVGHWNGSAWTEVPTGATESLYGIWGQSAASLYVVGGNGRVVHLVDGAVESSISVGGMVLSDIWGPSETELIATAGTTSVRFDGVTWTSYSTAPVRAYVITGTSSTNMFTLGFEVGHWNGTSWSELALPANLYDGLGSWGGGEGDIDVIDDEVFAAHNATLLHWTGLAPAGPALTNGTMSSVFAVSPTDVYAGGSGLFHFDGTGWSPTTFPTTQFTDVIGIWAGDGEVFATDGRVYRRQGPGWVDSGVNATGLWGTSGTDVWAVGSGGSLQQWDGTQWSPEPSPTTSNLGCIHGDATGVIAAGGAAGTVIRYAGNAGWTLLPPVGTANITAIWVGGLDDIWVLEQGGLIKHWDGAGWTDRSLVPLRGASGLSGLGERPVVSDGLNALLQWNGTSWAPLAGGSCPGPTFGMRLHGTATELWVYGFNGALGRYVP